MIDEYAKPFDCSESLVPFSCRPSSPSTTGPSIPSRPWVQHNTNHASTSTKYTTMDGGRRCCPHCYRANYFDSRPSSTLGCYGLGSLPQRPFIQPDLCFQEPLRDIYDRTVRKNSPILQHMPLRRRGSDFALGNSKLFAPSLRNPKFPWNRTSAKSSSSAQPAPLPPLRPRRPAPEQCPPKQKFLGIFRPSILSGRVNLPPKKSRIPRIEKASKSYPCIPLSEKTQEISQDFSSDPIHSTKNSHPHHHLAYMALTRGSALEPSDTTDPQSRSCNSLMSERKDGNSMPLFGTDESIVLKDKQSNKVTQCNSFSTLPSTASKMALRPSPLRPRKEGPTEGPPPIPMRSPLRSETIEVQDNSPSRPSGRTTSPVASLTRQSSYTTISIYSTDDDTSSTEEVDTPPSSPLQFPERHESRSSSVTDARLRAEKMRDELGIIDGVYEMYSDEERRLKHEADIVAVKPQLPYLPTLSRANSGKLSRTQMRARKKCAREDAVQKLNGARNDSFTSETVDFEQWLKSALQNEALPHHLATNATNNPCQHFPTLTKRQQGIGFGGQRLSEIPEETENHSSIHLGRDRERAISRNIVPSTSLPERIGNLGPPQPFAESAVLRRSASEPMMKAEHRSSLSALRQRLLTLMEDEREQSQRLQPTVSPTNFQQHPTIPIPSPPTPSSSSDAEGGPVNLQKVEIVWKGKTYPVLIGDGAKIWEGPCTDAYCKDHGGPRKEAMYGMF